MYLHNKVNSFQAGCLKPYLGRWKELTTDYEILTTVSGLKVEFLNSESLTVSRGKTSYPVSSKHSTVISNEIAKLVKKRVVAESTPENDEVISPIFLREKSDGNFRLILNLKTLNKSVEFHHFKMETIYSIMKLIRKNAFMIKIDIKDAYYSVPIADVDQKYFKFLHNGQLYKYTALPNGFSPGPRKFTKIVKVPLATLRQQDKIIVAGYIDDLFSTDMPFAACQQNVFKIVAMFDKLGFVVHPDKSEFEPKQEIEYLVLYLTLEK